MSISEPPLSHEDIVAAQAAKCLATSLVPDPDLPNSSHVIGCTLERGHDGDHAFGQLG